MNLKFEYSIIFPIIQMDSADGIMTFRRRYDRIQIPSEHNDKLEKIVSELLHCHRCIQIIHDLYTVIMIDAKCMPSTDDIDSILRSILTELQTYEMEHGNIQITNYTFTFHAYRKNALSGEFRWVHNTR